MAGLDFRWYVPQGDTSVFDIVSFSAASHSRVHGIGR